MERYRFPFRAMGSPCQIQLYANDPLQAADARRAVIEEVERIEARYSRYRPESLLSQLNRKAHRAEGFVVDSEFAEILQYAKTCFIQSEGLFDITSGVLRKAWTFDQGHGLPNQNLIEQLLPSIGFEKVHMEGHQVFFSEQGMEIDLGGIAKEYAADCAASVLMNLGVHNGVINFGGDIRILGPHPDGHPWEIGIHHPRLSDTLIATLELVEGAVATSGDYERAIVVNGKRYSHLLDPRTGWPVEGLQSVSVIAPVAVIAGSASTIGMLKGGAGKAWLNELGLPCLWVSENGHVEQSDFTQ